jgi:Dynamin family
VTTPHAPGPLTAAVIDLAEKAAGSADPRLSEIGGRCAGRLRAPLCIALVGRVSSGKSTLLNALLGTAVAPTDGRECTKIVYVFRHGGLTTASLVPRTGGDRPPVRFDGDRLPSEFEIPPSEIKYIDVTLPVPLLEEATLIDTPGLASTNAENSAVTERMLHDTGDSAAHADALLFCVNGPIKEDEDAAVRQFGRGRGASRLSSGSAVGILTRADQVGPDPLESWKSASELASEMSARHADLFSTVVPVVGLLAETAATGALRERHARALGALADAWTLDDSRFALSAPGTFSTEPGPVEEAMRRELLQLIGQYGIGEMLERIRSGTPADAASLTEVAGAASGVDEMIRQLRRSLGGRADVLKAGGALGELMDGAHDAGESGLYDAAQAMLDRPEMFPLRLITVAQQLATGAVTPPAGLVEQAWIAVQTGLPPTQRAEAARAAAAWRHWALLTDSAGQRVARVMVRAWQLAVDEDRP